MSPDSNKLRAQREAICRARTHLSGEDVVARLPALGLPLPDEQGRAAFRAFGVDVLLSLPTLTLNEQANGRDLRLGDQILLLHYLLCGQSLPAVPGDWVTFRDFPGGQFYWAPFLSRTVTPLVRGIGNDVARLRTRLSSFDWAPYPAGDCGAVVHAFGRVHILLVYHAGDEEAGPGAEVLFDGAARRAFAAEDAAYLASRVCLGLL